MKRSVDLRVLKQLEPVVAPPEADLASTDADVRRRALINTGRPRRAGAYFELPDGSLLWAEGEHAVLPRFALDHIKLSDLRRAAGRLQRHWAEVPMAAPLPDDSGEVTIMVTDLHPDDFWPLANRNDLDDFPQFEFELAATEGDLVVSSYIESHKDLTEEQAVSIVQHSAAAVSADVVDVESAWVSAGDQGWLLKLRLPQRGRTAGELIGAMESVRAVLSATTAEGVTSAAARRLLGAGHIDWLMGFPENQWLDAKKQPWDLSGDAGKIHLAEDVARFANADGGILVVGASTKKRGGVDTIDKVGGIAPGMVNAVQVEAILDRRVYPPIEGLRAFAIPLSHGNEVLVIDVPAQPDGQKPYLVHGAVIGPKVEGEFFSIVRRRGERSIPVSAREVHAWLAAGRRALGDARE